MKKVTLPDTEAALKELDGADDRAAIIVGSSILEYALEGYLASRVRKPENNEDIAILFGDRGLFGTFSLKISGAYFMRAIGPNTRHDLDAVRRIRNLAAHEMGSISFEKNPQISKKCREFRTIRRGTAYDVAKFSRRSDFMTTIHSLSLAMDVRFIEHHQGVNELNASITSCLDE